MLNITIDGRPTTAKKGMTILEIAQANSIYIPTLCHLDGVHDTANCRICMVEVEGSRGLQPSCTAKATDGMVIHTATENVLAARRTVVNLLLSNGEHNCLSCEAGGDCKLQEACYKLGVETPQFIFESNKPAEIDDSSQMIVRDNRKCIRCGRCLTACNHLAVNEVLDFGYRGGDTTVICDDGKAMGDSSCVQCGSCVQACPVGALLNKKSMGKARSWETRKVRTTCPYCGVGCQQILHVKGQEIVKVTGAEEGAPNKGRLCVKGRYGYDFIYSKDRLTTPLIKENGVFREASWDEALDLVASKFKAIVAKHGPDAIGGISCARSINEDSYVMQKLFRAVLKTNNIDHCARSCHAPTVAGLMTSFGTGGATNSLEELSRAKLLFCIGTNMTEAHPVASTFVKNAAKNGAKLIVVDPRRHRLADYATTFAQIKVGSDIAFLNGIMNVLITEDTYDKVFVAEHCENFDAFKTKVLEYPPARAAEISGVSEELIRDIAHQMWAIRPSMVVYTLGITEHSCGKNNVMSCANLQMLLGNIGMELAGVNPLRGQNNVQGACDMGALPNVFAGYQKVVEPAMREKFEKAWGVQGLSDKVGIMIPEMFKQALSGKLKALYIFGENIVNSEPDISYNEQVMEATEFLVCQDIFPTETTRFADVVLPAASWCEDEGTFVSCERRVSLVRKVKDAPGQAKPNWWIFQELAKRWGQDWGFTSGQDIWDNEFSVLAPAFSGIKVSRLQENGIQWPCPTVDHPGTPILHRDGRFTRGKGSLQPVDWTPPREVADAEYPFVLSTGRRLYHYHTRTQTGRCQGLDNLLPAETADMSIEDAQRLDIAHGEVVRVKSRRGEVQVQANVSDRIQPGMVWMSFHYREGNANWLTNTAHDPETMTPEFKACAVSVSKL